MRSFWAECRRPSPVPPSCIEPITPGSWFASSVMDERGRPRSTTSHEGARSAASPSATVPPSGTGRSRSGVDPIGDSAVQLVYRCQRAGGGPQFDPATAGLPGLPVSRRRIRVTAAPGSRGASDPRERMARRSSRWPQSGQCPRAVASPGTGRRGHRRLHGGPADAGKRAGGVRGRHRPVTTLRTCAGIRSGDAWGAAGACPWHSGRPASAATESPATDEVRWPARA